MEELSSRPDSLRLRWIFDPATPLLADHFPGFPIVPAFYQLARIVDATSSWFGVAPSRVRMRGVKFLKPLEPGREVDVALSPRVGARGATFTIICGDELVTQGELVFV